MQFEIVENAEQYATKLVKIAKIEDLLVPAHLVDRMVVTKPMTTTTVSYREFVKSATSIKKTVLYELSGFNTVDAHTPGGNDVIIVGDDTLVEFTPIVGLVTSMGEGTAFIINPREPVDGAPVCDFDYQDHHFDTAYEQLMAFIDKTNY